MRRRFPVFGAVLATLTLVATPAHATFRLMQIEQVIGGGGPTVFTNSGGDTVVVAP